MEAPPNSSSTASPSSGETRRKYKGLRRRKWGRWVSEIRLPNSRERIWLVSYDTPEKAARAFDAAFVCLRGTGGGADGLNFPGSSPPDVGRTSDPAKMCAAAESHANCAAVPPPPDATDGGAPPGTAAAAPAPALAPAATALQVSIPSSDWSELLLDSQQPLFSPTSETWSHPYLLAAAAADVDMEENESGSSFPGLWTF